MEVAKPAATPQMCVQAQLGGKRFRSAALRAVGRGLAPTPGRALSVQPPVPPHRPWLSPSATICLPCASISRCYGNGSCQGNG